MRAEAAPTPETGRDGEIDEADVPLPEAPNTLASRPGTEPRSDER